MKKLYIAIIVALLVLSVVLSFALNNMCRHSNLDLVNQREPFAIDVLTKEREERKHPFRFLKDENGNQLPIVALTAFFRSDEDKTRFKKFIDNNIKVIGITAYREFPKKILDSVEDQYHIHDDFNYLKEVKTWLYCMSNCFDYGFSRSHALLEMSESDFYTAEPNHSTVKKYDFLYICLKDDDQCSMNAWQSNVRNFSLAKRCLPILCNELNLKGLLVGRVGCGLEAVYGDKIETTDFLDYFELQKKMKESKFLFVPNISDASPRVVAECLIKNVPVLMNSNIICGSKYIHYETGTFFTSEYDIKKSAQSLLNKIPSISPRTWWSNNYSHQLSSIKLRNFLHEQYPEILEETKEVSLFV